MFRLLGFMYMISFICLIIQLLVVISVPVTGRSIGYNLSLSKFHDNVYGVLGICNQYLEICTSYKIGYPASIEDLDDDLKKKVALKDSGSSVLPSDAKYSISKLLVVHLLAFGFSFLLQATFLALFIRLYMYKRNYSKKHISITHANENENMSCGFDFRLNLSPYLNLIFIFSAIGFILNLLGFLVDILLFIPHLSYLGWFQICPTVLLPVISTFICLQKRAISSRKFLDNNQNYLQYDDMRTSRKVYNPQWNDNDSDDGFFVYTDGFYSVADGGDMFHSTNRKNLSADNNQNSVMQVEESASSSIVSESIHSGSTESIEMDILGDRMSNDINIYT